LQGKPWWRQTSYLQEILTNLKWSRGKQGCHHLCPGLPGGSGQELKEKKKGGTWRPRLALLPHLRLLNADATLLAAPSLARLPPLPTGHYWPPKNRLISALGCPPQPHFQLSMCTTPAPCSLSSLVF
jgi:hypothetical protein